MMGRLLLTPVGSVRLGCQMGDTVGMGVNEGDYNGELRLTRNSLTVACFFPSSLSAVVQTHRITKAVIEVC